MKIWLKVKKIFLKRFIINNDDNNGIVILCNISTNSGPYCRMWSTNNNNNGTYHSHRDYDLPACIYSADHKMWYRDGECHRDGDKPAVICCDGTKEWRSGSGYIHRDNGKPAVIYTNGDKEYWINGARILK